MIESLSVISTFVGLFALMDLLVEDKQKNIVAEYVFGFREHNFELFEQRLIQGLLDIYVKNNRLRFFRIILFYSIVGILIIWSWMFFKFDHLDLIERDGIDEYVLSGATSLFFMFCLSYPSDLWSVWVTKQIFYKKKRKFPISIFWIFLDIFLSLGVIIILVTIFSWLPVGSDGLIFGMIALEAYSLFMAAVTATIMMSLILLLMLPLGFGLRASMKITKLNTPIALYTKAHNYPFTFVGLIAGILTALVV